MENEKHKFPVKKPYVKVHRNHDSTNSSSTGKPDSLSYSYSCIKAFRENQNIIGNLAALHNKRQYQGLDHNPKLYNLSGERDNPICQPFYCSPESESDQTGKYDNSQIRFNIKSCQSSTDFQSESVLGLPDRNLLIEWFKYQLKCVNSLWPFSISRDSFIPKLCKKNRKMKMEMILNNIDEKTKQKLRKYVNDLRLNIEEHSNLCNESIIEIDVTPILADTQRLQAFLMFLRSIESNTSGAVNDSCESFENKTTLKKNFLTKQIIEGCSLFLPNKHSSINYIQKQEDKFGETKCKTDKRNFSFKKGVIYSTDPLAEEPFWPFKFPPRKDQNNDQWVNNEDVTLDCGEIENVPFSQIKTINVNNFTLDERPPSPNPTFSNNIKNKSKKHSALKKRRLNSTLAAIQETHRGHLDNGLYAKRKHTIQQENTSVCESSCEECISCKCLIHHKREDYNRYRKQCLFGKGDENSNNFIKYVAIREDLSQSKIHPYKKNCKNFREQSESVEDNRPYYQASSTESRNQQANNEFDQGRQSVSDVQIILRENKTNQQQSKEPKHKENLQVKNIVNKFKKVEELKSKIESESLVKEKKATVMKTVMSNYKKEGSMKHSTDKPNSSSSNVYPNKCRVVRVEDVEKLVCAINYSNESFSTNSCKESKNSNSNLDSQLVNENYKQISINACFESLNYSMNSVAWDTTTKSAFTTQPNSSCESTLSLNKKVLEKDSSSSDFTLPSNSVELKAFEKSTSTEEAEKAEKEREVPKKAEFRKESGFVKILFNREEHFNNKTSSHVKQYYNRFPPESIKYRSQEGERMFQQNGNKKVDTNYASQDKLRLLVKNANKLQEQILDFNKQLTTLNDENEVEMNNHNRHEQKKTFYDIKDELCKPDKMSMVIKINSNNSKPKIDKNTPMPNKNQIKLLFKPTYRSISSVSKGTNKKNNLMRSEKIEQYNYEQKINSSEDDNKVLGKKQIIKKTNKESGSRSSTDNENSYCSSLAFEKNSRSVSPQALQMDSTLVLKNLEKLYTELRSQRDDINDMKKLLNERIR